MLMHEFEVGMENRGVNVYNLPRALAHNWFRDCEKPYNEHIFDNHDEAYDYIAPKIRERKDRLLYGEFQTNLEFIYTLEQFWRDIKDSQRLPSDTRDKIDALVSRAVDIVYGDVWEHFDLKTGYYEDEKHTCYEYIVASIGALTGVLRSTPDVYKEKVAERVYKPVVELVKEQFRRYLTVSPSKSTDEKYRANLKKNEYLGDIEREDVIDVFIALIFKLYKVRILPDNVKRIF